MGYFLGVLFLFLHYFINLNVPYYVWLTCFLVNFGHDIYDFKYPYNGGSGYGG